jgi:hypothetical protein
MPDDLSPRARIVSRHFEVVDDQDRIVGNVKHATRAQAHDLREALIGMKGLGRLHVAEVTERLVIHRDVGRSAGWCADLAA